MVASLTLLTRTKSKQIIEVSNKKMPNLVHRTESKDKIEHSLLWDAEPSAGTDLPIRGKRGDKLKAEAGIGFFGVEIELK